MVASSVTTRFVRCEVYACPEFLPPSSANPSRLPRIVGDFQDNFRKGQASRGMNMKRGFLMLGLLLIWPSLMKAQEETRPPVRPHAFKLNSADGCYRYIGDAMLFVGRFRAGSYIGVTMNTLDPNGLPSRPDKEERIPSSDAPDFQTDSSGSWFGPLPQSKEYTITFIPRAAFGSSAVVSICGRMTPPQ